MPEKVFIIKHGAFGDVVQGFDAFASLRHSLHDARITLLTTPPYEQFLNASGWFDEIITDKRAPAWNLAETWRMGALLRKKWDKVIDLQCSRRSSSYARMVSKGTRWFGTAPQASDPMPDFTGVTNRERMLTAVVMAGARKVNPDLSFLMAALPAHMQSRLQTTYALILPGTSDAKPSKRWPIERYIQLVEALSAEGLQPVLGGTEIDRPVTSKIVRAFSSCLDLTGQTDFFTLAGLAGRASCVIGNDTGPVFLAARLNAPTVMLMGADTEPSMSAPFGEKAQWIKKDRLDQLSFDEVWETVEIALK